jgi:2-iminoacetate synthase
MTAAIDRILARDAIAIEDFVLLCSEEAAPHLEAMAGRARDLSIQYFGRTIALFTPLYISDHCENSCLYCGFRAGNAIPRRTLTLEEVEAEASVIDQEGFAHILLLTGDDRSACPVAFIEECVRGMARRFASVGLEIYALTEEEYATMVRAGADGLVIYQETYDRDLYARLHTNGPKADFDFRHAAPWRAAAAGIRTVSLGFLLGLGDWRAEASGLARQALGLLHDHPGVEVGVALPRFRPHHGGRRPSRALGDLRHPVAAEDTRSSSAAGATDGAFRRHGDFRIPSPVADRHFVQLLCALRILLPRSAITVSTRERADLRDAILPLGVTRISAAARTAVGARTSPAKSVGQFEIEDGRDLAETIAAIRAAGYQPVLKDWI